MKRLTEKSRSSLISEYISGAPTNVLSKKYKISISAVHYILKSRGVKTRSYSESFKKHTADELSFSEPLGCPLKSYWVGFLMADGCISDSGKGSPLVKLSLRSSDREHIEKFKTFTKATNPIRDYQKIKNGSKRRISSISIRSSIMAEALILCGVTPRKSKTAKASPEMECNKHFWRGVIDGNGTISWRKRKETKKTAITIGLVGSFDLVSQFSSFIRTVSPQFNGQPSRHKSIFKVSAESKVAIAIIRHLYDVESTCLSRKKTVADQAMKLCDDSGGTYEDREKLLSSKSHPN